MERTMADPEHENHQAAYAKHMLGLDNRYKELNAKLLAAFEQMKGIADTITDPNLSARLTTLIDDATQSQEALKEEFGFKMK